MIVATCFYGTMFAGVFSNHTDIASNYAGLLMGITNMSATIPGTTLSVNHTKTDSVLSQRLALLSLSLKLNGRALISNMIAEKACTQAMW